MSLVRRSSIVVAVLVFFKDDILGMLANRFGATAPVYHMFDGARILDDYYNDMIRSLGALVAQATDPFELYANATSKAVLTLIPLVENHAAPYIGQSAAASICLLVEDLGSAPGGLYSIAIRVFRTGHHVYQAFTESAMHIHTCGNARLLTLVKILAGTVAVTVMMQLVYLALVLLSAIWAMVNRCLRDGRGALAALIY